MKFYQTKNSIPTNFNHSPFFQKESGSNFFGKDNQPKSFFNSNTIQTKLTIGEPGNKYEKENDAMADKVLQRPATPGSLTKKETVVHSKPSTAGISPTLQRKCAACEQEENMIQRQEHPDPTESKPVSPGNTQPIAPVPYGKAPRAANCSQDPKFPDFGCLGQQLKLDIDENLLNNAHQFSRVATLFPDDKDLMLDTFLRYGVGKNLLETSFGFVGLNKKWSSILSYGTGVALKTYDLVKNGQLKLDLQLPMGKGVNLDIGIDLTPDTKKPQGGTDLNTTIGISGRF